MEEKKNNKGLVWLIVVLIILVLGLVGYIVYDKVLTDKSTENINNSDSNSEILNNEDEKVDLNNNYEVFAKNLKSQFSKYDSNNQSYLYVNSDILSDGYNVYLTENQTLFIKYLNKELNDKYGDYKIADNVLSYHVICTGQGGGNMLYFINENGTVGSADIEYGIGEDGITIKKDIGYKNIVSIISGTFGNGYSGVNGAIFIDINGNIFSENLK